MTRAQTAHLKGRFLAALGRTGNVSLACAESGAPRREVYRWKMGDQAFAAAYADAETEATEHLEAEARRRAVDGLLQKKFTRSGEPIIDPATGAQYAERAYSDTLLIVLLKARAPDTYRERTQTELTGRNGGPINAAIQIQAVDYRAAIAPLAPPAAPPDADPA